MNRKSLITYAALALLTAASLASTTESASAEGESGSLGAFTVSGQSNIFGADHATPPAPSGGGGGVLPTEIALPSSAAGKSIAFNAVTGTVNCQGGTPFSGPDGQTGGANTAIQSFGGIASAITLGGTSCAGPLIGVFTDSNEPADPSPARLDFTTGVGEGFTSVAPMVDQAFFVGDGLTGTGSGDQQTFSIPAGATTLWLGFIDGHDYQSAPGWYDDNAGSISGTVTLAGVETQQPKPHLNIAVVGDSYSAGNGAGGYYGPPGCYRSDRNWAGLYRTYLADHGYTVDSYTNAACSGGVTENFRHLRKVAYRYPGAGPCPHTPDEIGQVVSRGRYVACEVTALRPQVLSITPGINLVLFTFGGNDAKFADIVDQCFGEKHLGRCRARIQEGQRLIDSGELRHRLVDNVLMPMRSAMGGSATSNIIMLGYPPLVANDGYTLKSNGETYHVSQSLLKLQQDANDLQADIAAKLNAEPGPRVTFISAVPFPDPKKLSFVGHEPLPLRCNSPSLNGPACPGVAQNPDAWVNGILTTRIKFEWYHPNHRGHEAYRDLLAAFGPL